jgi:hypothetical protein
VSISLQVKRATGLMLVQLTQLLSGNVKLPLSIRIIGYLRRMEAYAEPELRISIRLPYLTLYSFPAAKKPVSCQTSLSD